jgi:hypothetical protein
MVLGDKGYPEGRQPRSRRAPRPWRRANAQLKSWRIVRNSAAVLGAPGSWPRRSTFFSYAKPDDEKVH